MNDHPSLLKAIDDLNKRIDKLERFPQPPTMVDSNLAETAFSLPAAGTAGDIVIAYFNLHNANSFKMLGAPRLEVYKNSTISADNLWPLGANWTATELRGLDIIPLTVRTTPYTTDYNDLMVYYFFRNRGAGAISGLMCFCDWRFPQLQGGT